MFIILFVFLLAGAWHGAGWNFLIFGLIHGIGLIINHSYRKFNTLNLNKLFSWFLTLNYGNLSFIFFRLTDLRQTLWIQVFKQSSLGHYWEKYFK